MKEGTIGALRILHDFSKAISSTLDVDMVVETILEKTSAMMGTDKVLLLLLDGEDNTLYVRGSAGFSEGELRATRFYNVGSFDHCIVHKGSVITLKEILPRGYYSRIAAIMPVLDGMVFAPLETGGRARGLLGIEAGRRRLSKVELEILCSIASQSAVGIENGKLYRKLHDAFLHTAEALAEAITSRDPYTGGHTRRVVEYSQKLSSSLGLSPEEEEDLKLAAILHDVGKIGIDDAILRKGGLLSEREEALMRMHPEIGARILGFVEEMHGVIPGVLYHHERFDGTGYPEGLKGDEIPLQAKIIAVADAYDALTTERPYKKALDRDEAIEEVRRSCGSHFDPSIAGPFCELMKEESPVGKD